jgi:3-hydroxymyristoyl/3-hydroxydecanoyl-(acyl carrier protein) dehydratase
MASVVAGRFVVPADHPSLPGHFPDRPIVPGVILLDLVLTLILPPGQRAAALAGVKFTGAVRPGETVEVSAAPARPGPMGVTVAFSATACGHAVLRGMAVLAAQ